MLSADARRRLTVVLVGARNPQNIGAAARAMHDFGFADLRVVNDFAPPFEAAQLEAKSAVRAEEVMRSARLYTTLAEAIADCTLVAGTTALGDRNLELPVQPLKDAVVALQAALDAPQGSGAAQTDEQPRAGGAAPAYSGSRVALLFGSEKTGLTRDQLSFCSVLLTIPMFAPEGRHLSMNLGQSVAVCLYELTRAGFEGARMMVPAPEHPVATVQDRERLHALVLEAMHLSGYAQRFPANARPTVVRQLIAQMAATQEQAATWMGVFRMVLRRLSPGSAPSPTQPSE